MHELNLNQVASSLLNDKWMISNTDFISLVNQVNHYMQNPQLLKDVAVNEPEFKVDSNDTNGNQTAIINISGKLQKGASPLAESLLGLVNTDFIAEALDDAANDPSVKDIVLIFNTPGGNTTGIEELGRKIKEIDAVKPVYGWIEQQACSAGYWLLSQCRTLAMAPSASVGSIGVFVVIDDISEALKASGISKQAIFSGKYKLLGAPFKSLSKDERDILQADVDKTHQQFKDVILSKRQIESEYLEGLSYNGLDALKANLVDIVLDNFGQFLTTINTTDMKSYNKVNKPQASSAVVPAPEAVSTEVNKQAAAPDEKEADVVPGVPGKKAEHGGYGKGYVACPACKLTYKLEDHHFVDPSAEDEDGDEKAVKPGDEDQNEVGKEKPEPEEKPEPKEDPEPKDDIKDLPKQPEDKLEKKAVTFKEWKDSKTGTPVKQVSKFKAAIEDWQKGHNLSNL